MAIKGSIRGGSDGEHAHGSARTSYSMKNGRTPIDNSRADEVDPASGALANVKQAVINAGNKIATSGYGSAALIGAGIGAAALGGLNLENMDAPVVNASMAGSGAIVGAGIGVAGKFMNDARKMPNGRDRKMPNDNDRQ